MNCAEIQKSWQRYMKSCVFRFVFLITILFFSLFKKVVVKNFRCLSGKHQCRNLFLNKDRLKLHAATIFIKKDTPVKVFSCEC